jgi:hypothetical protein
LTNRYRQITDGHTSVVEATMSRAARLALRRYDDTDWDFPVDGAEVCRCLGHDCDAR